MRAREPTLAVLFSLSRPDFATFIFATNLRDRTLVKDIIAEQKFIIELREHYYIRVER